MESLGFERVREIAGPRALAVLDCELTDLGSEGVLDAYRRDLDSRYDQGLFILFGPQFFLIIYIQIFG